MNNMIMESYEGIAYPEKIPTQDNKAPPSR